MPFSCIYNIYICISLSALSKLANLDSFCMAVYKFGNWTAISGFIFLVWNFSYFDHLAPNSYFCLFYIYDDQAIAAAISAPTQKLELARELQCICTVAEPPRFWPSSRACIAYILRNVCALKN